MGCLSRLLLLVHLSEPHEVKQWLLGGALAVVHLCEVNLQNLNMSWPCPNPMLSYLMNISIALNKTNLKFVNKVFGLICSRNRKIDELLPLLL